MPWLDLEEGLAEIWGEASGLGHRRFASEERTGEDRPALRGRIVGPARHVDTAKHGLARPDAVCCPHCGSLRDVTGHGRPPVYCSQHCRRVTARAEQRAAADESVLRTGQARRIVEHMRGQRWPHRLIYTCRCSWPLCQKEFQSTVRTARFCSWRCNDRLKNEELRQAADRSPLRSASSIAAELRIAAKRASQQNAPALHISLDYKSDSPQDGRHGGEHDGTRTHAFAQRDTSMS